MRTLLLLINLLLLLTSCNLQKRCAALYPVGRDTTFINSDSVTTRITFRDVPVFVPLIGAPLKINAPVIGLIPGYTNQQISKHTTLMMKVDSAGILSVLCKTDSLIEVLARVADTLKESRSRRQQIIKVTTTVSVPKPYVPWWVWALVIAVTVYIVWRLRSSLGILAGKAINIFK